MSVEAKEHRRNARLRVVETFVEQLSSKPLPCGLWLRLVFAIDNGDIPPQNIHIKLFRYGQLVKTVRQTDEIIDTKS
jgi:hypothetical protein